MTSTRQGKPERDRTDESLACERTKTDDELFKRSGGVEEAADAVVTTAREHADEVVRRSRQEADAQLLARVPMAARGVR
ncbi:MAG TPA: hypothetical protein VFQ61_34815 [Polyangiaceae bacterium]|nr:hypothetical protein [Polyangiaceae bacterium]